MQPRFDLNGLLFFDNESRLSFDSTFVSYNYSRNFVFNLPIDREWAMNKKDVYFQLLFPYSDIAFH